MLPGVVWSCLLSVLNIFTDRKTIEVEMKETEEDVEVKKPSYREQVRLYILKVCVIILTYAHRKRSPISGCYLNFQLDHYLKSSVCLLCPAKYFTVKHLLLVPLVWTSSLWDLVPLFCNWLLSNLNYEIFTFLESVTDFYFEFIVLDQVCLWGGCL